MMSKVSIGVLQLDSRDTLEKNIDNLVTHVQRAQVEEPHILILPELWVTGFNKEKIDRFYVNNEEKAILDTLVEMRDQYKVSIFGSIPHQCSGKRYNAIPLIVYNGMNSGVSSLHWYYKLALFKALKEDTALKIRPATDLNGSESTNVPLIDLPIHGHKIRVGLSICGELRFPLQYYKYVEHGCHLLINCSQWRGRVLDRKSAPPSHFEQWEILLKARAIESQRYVLGANRIGREADYDYEGASMLINPDGEWVEPTRVFVAPNSRFGEKIKIYEVPLLDLINGPSGRLIDRRASISYWRTFAF